MKAFILFLLLYITSALGFSQDSSPLSWQLGLTNDYPVVALPNIDLSKVIAEDLINDLDKSIPWRYGVAREVHLDILNQGQLIEFDNGDRLWRIGIKSNGALNIGLNFDAFQLPQGSRLQFFNVSGTDASKIYNAGNNRDSQRLGGWFVEGEVIVVEYFQPFSATGNVSLQIGSLIHGYRMGRVHQFFESGRGLEDSGNCNYDVNCSIGSDFQSKKDLVKRAVALLNLGNGRLCTAVLINNTAADKKPLILTANHCLQDSNPELWSVRFNWMSPSPICGEEADSEDIQTNFTMSGAQLRAHNTASDFALVELYNPIPNSWDVVFAGWDRSDEIPQYQVGIHHPSGDIMKVCRDDDPLVKEMANGTEVWLVRGNSAGNGNGWDLGVTESGSSGSPLFSDSGKIIGQLYAGWSACDGTDNNQEFDLYGRFASSWSNSNETNSLMPWLDPLGVGLLEISSMENALTIGDFELDAQLMVYPNPVADIVTIVNTRYPNLSYTFFSVNGTIITKGMMSDSQNYLDLSSFANGIYFLRLVDEDSQKSITKKIIVAH